MNGRLSGLLVLLAVAAIAYPTLGAPPAPPQTRAFTFTVEPVPCTTETDGICLGYNGQIPGPTLDVNVGDTIVITLQNAYTRDASWHVHGTALSASEDGIRSVDGAFVDSFAPPNGSFTYHVRAVNAGAWHYHDHVLGMDGSEGVHRGLYGSLIVRNGAEPRPDITYDVHLLDAGPNGGRPVFANVTLGTNVELSVVGLGNLIQTVTLRDPTGAAIQSASIAPGISHAIRFTANMTGTYKLRGVTTDATIGVIP